MGMREKLKRGEMTAEEALAVVENSGEPVSKRFVAWVKKESYKRKVDPSVKKTKKDKKSNKKNKNEDGWTHDELRRPREESPV